MAPTLHADQVCWRPGGVPVLADVDLQLSAGEMLGLIGPNGAGKSSLLRILAGITRPDQGSVHLEGRDYRQLKPDAMAAKVGYLPQNPPLHWPLLVNRLLELGRLPYQGFFRRLSAQDTQAIAQAVATTGIEALLGRVVTSLSEGEKMLVLFARLLATEPTLVLADEPIAALDPHHQLLIMEKFQSLLTRQAHFAAVVVLHDLNLAARFCQRLVLLHQGRVVAEGTPAEVLNPANLQRYYGIQADIQTRDGTLQVMIRNRVKTHS
ncbi:MAG: ABC transporter ATP-binding protein [Pseudomonadales bacterium]|nr:ABC transporter ATP-binding protein [Pseudomonadales bacterium]